MNRIALFSASMLLTVACNLSLYAQKKADAATMDTLIVQAKLVEIPGKFAPNDLYNYVYIMKYRVVSVEKGEYTLQDLLVGHYNPLIPRKQITGKMDQFVDGDVDKFEIGAKHSLVLVKPLERIWGDAVEDEYFDSELDKYFALKTEKVK